MADSLDESVAAPLKLLLKANSKDMVKNLLEDGFLYRSSNGNIVKTLSGSLSVDFNEAEQLMHSIVQLVKISLYNYSTSDPQQIANIFPDHCGDPNPFMTKVEDKDNSNIDLSSVRCVNVELTKEKLDTVLDGLGKIRDQLTSVAK